MTPSLFDFDSDGAARVRDDVSTHPAHGTGHLAAVLPVAPASPGWPGHTPPPRGAQEGGTFPDPASVHAAEERAQQAAHKTRVRTGIGGIILDFCRERGAGGVFTAAELRAYVEARNGGRAPSSADRILRDLRSDRLVTYQVDRAASRYTIESVSLEAP